MFLDSSFIYTGSDPDAVAMENSENLLLKNVDVKGYKTIVKNVGKQLRDGLSADSSRREDKWTVNFRRGLCTLMSNLVLAMTC